jgi:transcriptional regulator with XRE-family HTH domain
MSFDTSLGDRLRIERNRIKLSGQQLAKATGVSGRTQRTYEAGEYSPKADYLVAAAAAGIDLHFVLGCIKGGTSADESKVSAAVVHAVELVEAACAAVGICLSIRKKALVIGMVSRDCLAGRMVSTDDLNRLLDLALERPASPQDQPVNRAPWSGPKSLVLVPLQPSAAGVFEGPQ